MFVDSTNETDHGNVNGINHRQARYGLYQSSIIENCVKWLSTNDPAIYGNSSTLSTEQFEYWSKTSYQFDSKYKVSVQAVVQIIGNNDVDIHQEVLDSTIALQMVYLDIRVRQLQRNL